MFAGAAALVVLAGQGAAPAGNRDISGNGPDLAASVPMIALDPSQPGLVAIAWRVFSTPLQSNSPGVDARAECYLSVSRDGGRSFRTSRPAIFTQGDHCNAPYVAAGAGKLFFGATVTRPRTADELASGALPSGYVSAARSDDGGGHWTPVAAAIGTDTQDRFAAASFVPTEAKRHGWDGARGAYDSSTGSFSVTGAFPAGFDGDVHSQRFVTTSHDGAQTFGSIHSFDDADWPGRWDGDIAAAHGTLLLAYIAGAVPGGQACPCIVLGTSKDDGRTIDHKFVAAASDYSIADIVHVPVVAADGSRRGHYAIGAIGPDNHSARVFVTEDGGSHWRTLSPAQDPDIVKVTRVGIGFAADGTIVAAWRGTRADGRYDLYAAAARRGFGPTVRVSSASSLRPSTIAAKGFEGGDFVSWVSASQDAAHFAWSDARDGKTVRVFYATVPLATFRPA